MELRVEYRPMDEVLREADFVSLNAAFTKETYHLIGARELALMKPTAIFINTARGPMVDEQALVDALASTYSRTSRRCTRIFSAWTARRSRPTWGAPCGTRGNRSP